MSSNCIAMLLAGGQGSRLQSLTKNNAKPAVRFGGKYRIIDFSLSSCFHSNIFTVGVLTQYKPLFLNRYIGTGSAWALDKIGQGVYILPPFMDKKGGNWYLGTADAVYQNTNFIDMYNPEYVLILSGDHIYTMDYSKMLEFASSKEADLCIAVREVEWSEASRFGITNVDKDMKIVEFEEKPEKPKNNMASMGIYMFKWSVLKSALQRDAQIKSSNHDFGKNIIPMLMEEGKNVYSYIFDGYWRDVGTIESYYKANMDLLKEDLELNLSGQNLRIYSNNTNKQPHYIGNNAGIKNSLVCDGCIVEGSVENSIVSYNVKIGKGSVIRDSIVFNNVVIEDDVTIDKSIIGENMIIENKKTIGSIKSKSITVIA